MWERIRGPVELLITAHFCYMGCDANLFPVLTKVSITLTSILPREPGEATCAHREDELRGKATSVGPLAKMHNLFYAVN